MLAKCANPSCLKHFRYLHEGTLYRIETFKSEEHGRSTHSEWFWICEECASEVVLKAEISKLSEAPFARKTIENRSAEHQIVEVRK